MHKPTRVCIREFLNLPGFNAGAYVLAEVEDTSRWNLEQNHGPELTLELADCYRRINLDKLDTLIDALWRSRQALTEEAALLAKRQAELARRNADPWRRPPGGATSVASPERRLP